MDTIKSTLDAAGKAIFGDGTQNQQTQQGQNVEPQSGVTGNTKAGEPYDAGNIDQTTTGTNTSSSIGGSGYTQKDDAHAFETSHDLPRDDQNTGNPLTSPGSRDTNTNTNTSNLSGQHPGGSTVSTGNDGTSGQTGNTSLIGDNERHRTQASSTGFSGTSGSIGGLSSGLGDKNAPSSREDSTLASKAGAAVGAVMGGGTAQKQGGQGGSYGATQQQHSSVGAVGKNQGADVPHKEPEHDHEHDAIRDSKRHAENIASGGDSAADPKPYAGDDKPRQGSLTGHLPGAPGGEGLQKTSKGHGTGQQYVKSSGLAAEGGDFDASKPGAGKEADRLLEEKGIEHGTAKPKPTDNTASTTGGTGGGHSTGHSSGTIGNTSAAAGADTEPKEKKSLKDKLKDKLHKH